MPFDFACPDWERRLEAGESLVPDLPLDKEEADRAVGIFNRLRLPDVPGMPTLDVAAGEWQRDIVRCLFGSLIDGKRMVPEILALVPKKNSKTTGGAAMSITALLMNERPRAEFIYVGPTQEIADLAFQQAAGMIECDQYLTDRFHVQHSRKTIIDRLNKAKLKVKTFDMKVMTGSRPVFVLLDELHLMATINGADRVIRQIRGGMMSSPEAMFVMITTQSDIPPEGVFKTELMYARGVRDGIYTKSVKMLPILYEFPFAMQKDGTWKNPEYWHMVHPNLGRPFTVADLIEDYENEQDKGEEAMRLWASQHLNVQIGLAMHLDRWLGADYWEDRTDLELSLDVILDRSDVVTVGIDAGGLDDLFGLCVLGRCKKTGNWLAWYHAWCWEVTLKRRKSISQALEQFAKEGDLTICKDGSPDQDIKDVAAIISNINKRGLIPEEDGIGLDPRMVSDLVKILKENGITDEQLCGVPQGTKLSSAIWGMERKLKDKRFWHCGRPMMNWVLGNAKAEQRGNSIYI